MHDHLKSLLLDALNACAPRIAAADLLDDDAENARLDPCADENEYASRVTEMGIALCLKARMRERRAQLEHALKRLEARDYGVCDECGEDIALPRLLANPAATLCVHCQADREYGRGHGYAHGQQLRCA